MKSLSPEQKREQILSFVPPSEPEEPFVPEWPAVTDI